MGRAAPSAAGPPTGRLVSPGERGSLSEPPAGRAGLLLVVGPWAEGQADLLTNTWGRCQIPFSRPSQERRWTQWVPRRPQTFSGWIRLWTKWPLRSARCKVGERVDPSTVCSCS